MSMSTQPTATEPADALRHEEAARLWDEITNSRIPLARITDAQLLLLERSLPSDHEARYGVTPGDPDCPTQLEQIRQFRDAELRKVVQQRVTHPMQLSTPADGWRRRKIQRRTGVVELVIFKLSDPDEGAGEPIFDWAQMPAGRGCRALYAGMLAARVVTQRYEYHKQALEREQKEEEGYSQVALGELWKRADLRRAEILPDDQSS